jgi:hypothetical protein
MQIGLREHRARRTSLSTTASLGVVSDLRENFLVPRWQQSICADLPFRTPYHKAWQKKSYNVFGHIMGQYKGALNPAAHGQDIFESKRVFHGGDNVFIETFSGAFSGDINQNLEGNLTKFAVTSSIIEILLQFYRNFAHVAYTDKRPLLTMILNFIASVGIIILSLVQLRPNPKFNTGLLLFSNSAILAVLHGFSFLYDMATMIFGQTFIFLTRQQTFGFMHLLLLHILSSIAMLPLFQFLRLSMMKVQSERNQLRQKLKDLNTSSYSATLI